MAVRLTIVPELLIKNLTALPTEKQDENFENLKTHSPGAAYLCEKILFPLIRGERFNMCELDMSAFSVTDIPKVASITTNIFRMIVTKTSSLYISAKNYAKKSRLLKKQNLYNGG